MNTIYFDVYLVDNLIIIWDINYNYSEYIKLYSMFLGNVQYEILLSNYKSNKLLNFLNETKFKNKENVKCLIEDLNKYSEEIQFITFENEIDLFENEYILDKFVLVYNVNLKIAQIIDNSEFEDLSGILFNFKNFEYIKTFQETEINPENLKQINTFLFSTKFENKNALLLKIVYIEKLFDISKLNNLTSVLFQRYFTITLDSKDRVRCPLIYSFFEKEFPEVPKLEIKTNIINLLTQNKVERKRYSDGYSFVGIVFHPNEPLIELSNTH